jgi:hypothetical protein
VRDLSDKKLNNMQPVLLPLLCHNDNTILFDELGIEYNYENLTRVEFMFFVIEYACSNTKNDREFTEIVSNGESFVVDLTWHEFKKLFK